MIYWPSNLELSEVHRKFMTRFNLCPAPPYVILPYLTLHVLLILPYLPCIMLHQITLHALVGKVDTAATARCLDHTSGSTIAITRQRSRLGPRSSI